MQEIGNWLKNQMNQYRYIEFLTKVLKATKESNAQLKVYQLLTKNTEYFNQKLIEVLQRWAQMFEHQQALDDGHLVEYANGIGLDKLLLVCHDSATPYRVG